MADTAKSLYDCVKLATERAEAARSVRSDVIVLVHGGPSRSRLTCRYFLNQATGFARTHHRPG